MDDEEEFEAALEEEQRIAEEARIFAAEAEAGAAAEAEAAAAFAEGEEDEEANAANGPAPRAAPVQERERRPARRAARSRSYVGQDGGGDARSEASSDAGGHASGQRPTRRSRGQDDDESMRFGLEDAGSSYSTHHLNKGLSSVPGWGPQIMGSGIIPKPPVFATGLPGHWVQYTNTGPFKPDKRCRPARVIDLGFVGAWQQASDAERVSDMNAQTEQVARARTVATCALMGLLSVGTAKGLVASDNHSELTRAKADAKPAGDDDDEEDASLFKLKRKLNGKIKTYTYCPNAEDTDPNVRNQTAMMFCYVHIAMYDRASKYVGFKILMLIFDKGFSTDLLVRKVMEENALIKASGQINGMPEDQRIGKLERQNKLQRTQISDENLETTAQIQSRRICSNQDWIKFMESVGGKMDGHDGRPYYENIKEDTRAGCATDPFIEHPTWGGQHPVGPSVSHNHKRYLPPTEDHPGVNVSIAGTLDARGTPIDLHPSLVDPTEWYDPVTMHFDPPQHVKDNGWCHLCHDPSITNIFNAPLPQKMHGNVEPDDILLREFWELYKDSNPILSKAQQKGRLTFEQNRDSVLSLFHREDDLDPEQQRLSRAVLETDLLGPDSIDKSASEEAIIERRAYGKTSQEKNGDVWVFSVRQQLRDHSIEQEKVHAMVNEYDKQRRAELRSANYNAQQAQYQVFNRREEMRKRQVEHAEATSACIKLGLQRFEHAYGRKKARKSIPPGYFDVAFTGLKDAVKEAGEIAARRNAAGFGRLVDPQDSNAGIGTANIGFAHSQSLVATDLTPFGHHRAFLMHMFSGALRIAGGDVKLMLDMHCHAFEPFQEVSYFLLLCGGAGSGKSMRAKRLQALLPEGWVKGSGSSSAKAGMNGGMDYLCGRLVYYDEIPNDFASTDSERIEYLKSVTMEQRVLNTRTVKVMGENGMESWTTVVLDSLHYESYLICTNCGPLGLKGEHQEPSTNRAALTDRTWAHIVHSAEDDDDTGDVEFDIQSLTDEVKQQVNRYRVCACLVAYVLIYIKHIPSCRPNLTYANMLTNKWYDIQWNEYNVQKPTKRKKIKLRMLLELFATESAVFEKFILRESGVDFADMRPGEDGYLAPFCIEQLTDVVRSLQRCVDLEVIHTAWSHSHDHSPMTSAHRFQMMTELAGLHGTELDQSTLRGETGMPQPHDPPAHQGRCEEEQDQESGVDYACIQSNKTDHAAWLESQAASGAAASQGRGPEPVEDDHLPDAEALAQSNAQFDAQFAFGASAVAAPPPAPAPPPIAAEAVMGLANRSRDANAPGAPPAPAPAPPPLPPQWNTYYDAPLESARNVHGGATNNTATIVRMMDREVSRSECSERAAELGQRRALRCEMSKRLVSQSMPRDRESQLNQLTRLFTDKRGKNNERLLRIEATGKYVCAKLAAGACMPDLQDVLNSGIEAQFVKDMVQGKPSQSFGSDHATTGVQAGMLWEYKKRESGEGAMNMPADYDFNQAILKAFSKSSGGGDGASGGGTSAQKQKSVWSNSAREIKKLSQGGSTSYSLMKAKSMTVESMRDTIFQLAQALNENKVLIPRSSATDRHQLNEESCMLSGNKKFTDATKPPQYIHPNGMMILKDGKLGHDPRFLAPLGFDTLTKSATVGSSGCKRRLDHMVDKRALPSCVLPESFERGVPVTGCEASNGIYVNKYIASQHVALVVESSHYLANVPGIATGVVAEVPGSFKVRDMTKSKNEADEDDADDGVEEVRKEVGAKRKAADEGATPPPKKTRLEEEEAGKEVDEEAVEEAVEDDDDAFAEAEVEEAPDLPEGDTPSDLDSVERSVSRPEADELNVNPKPGACDKAAGASIDPSAKVGALPLLWDQGAMFFSMKMAATLHNDCKEYVEAVRNKYPDAYDNEDMDETLEKLPHITLRFPGTVEREKNTLFPLSCSIPLEESRYCDIGKQVASTRASKGLTEAVHSIAHGRAVSFNDPEVLEYEAEARGVNSGFVMEGNLFARSTWQRFTLSALDARGMRTPEEERRVNDQGLCMSHRVRNYLAANDREVRNVAFGGGTLADSFTFAGQERKKRKRASEAECESTDMESAAAQSYAMDAETNHEVMEESRKEVFEI